MVARAKRGCRRHLRRTQDRYRDFCPPMAWCTGAVCVRYRTFGPTA